MLTKSNVRNICQQKGRKQGGTSIGITEVNNIPFIPSVVGTVIFIGAVLLG